MALYKFTYLLTYLLIGHQEVHSDVIFKVMILVSRPSQDSKCVIFDLVLNSKTFDMRYTKQYTMHILFAVCRVWSEYIMFDMYFLSTYYMRCAIYVHFWVIGLGFGIGLKECGYGPDVGLGFLILLPRWSAGNTKKALTHLQSACLTRSHLASPSSSLSTIAENT